MNSSDDFAPAFRLHSWLVQPELNRVSGPDGEVRLEPRVMLVLVRLARVPGRVVTRNELLDEVWGETIVGEESLTRAISDLRRVLGDNPRQPVYIETIRNHGYRLVAPVTPAPDEEPVAAGPTPPAEESTAPAVEPSRPDPEPTPAPPFNSSAPPPRRRYLPWGTLVALVAVAALFFGRRFFGSDAPPPASLPTAIASLEALPLTSFAGHERHPAFSPDGTRVAFVWSGPDDGVHGVWVKQRDSASPLRLSDAPGWAAWPTWRPDGQAVAWVQVGGDGSEIRVVPSLGGADRTLHATPGAIAGLDWSPDSARLVFSVRDTTTGGHRLHMLDMATLAVTVVPLARPAGTSDIQPRFSPDGRRLAWIGLEGGGGSGLWVADLPAGPARRIIAGPGSLERAAWTADGAGLVFASAPAGKYHLWFIGTDGGEARRLTGASEFAWNPSIARETGDLVYEQVTVDRDIWRVRILERGPWRLETGIFLSSTRWEYEADYSPDGGRIAFISARTGAPELWVCDRDGGGLRQLTSLGGEAVAHPRWSPDGRRIAANVLGAAAARVVVVAVGSGQLEDVTVPGEDEMLAGWHPEGRELLVVRRDDSSWNLHQRPVEPGQDGRRLRAGVVAADASPGGVLHFVQDGQLGLWRVPLADPTAAAELIVPDLAPTDRHNWRVVGDEVFWVMRAPGEAFLMVEGPGAAGSSIVTDLPSLAGSGLAVAPDGHAVLFPRSGPAEGDLMLIRRESLPGPRSSD